MEDKLLEFKEYFESLPKEKQIEFINAIKEVYGIDLEENEEIKKGVR